MGNNHFCEHNYSGNERGAGGLHRRREKGRNTGPISLGLDLIGVAQLENTRILGSTKICYQETIYSGMKYHSLVNSILFQLQI